MTNLEPNEWLTARQMADKLDVDWGWVKRRLPQLFYTPENRRHRSGRVHLHYPPECLTALRRMRQTETDYPPAGDWLTLWRLARAVHRSGVWTANRLRYLGVQPERRMSIIGRSGLYYPHELTSVLSELAEEHEEPNGWLTLNQLADRLGVDREWIQARLDEVGAEAQTKRIPGSGKLADHYPPVLARLLRRMLREVPESEDWLTANALERMLERSTSWIRRRLPRYVELAEMRRDEQGVARLHYPPNVLAELLQEREAFVPMKPLWQLLLKLRGKYRFRWIELRQAGDIKQPMAEIGRRKSIPKSLANRIVEGLLVILPDEDLELRAYADKLNTDVTALPAVKKNPRRHRRRKPKARGRHVLELRKVDGWIVPVCEPCAWSSKEGYESEKAARQSFAAHFQGRSA